MIGRRGTVNLARPSPPRCEGFAMRRLMEVLNARPKRSRDRGVRRLRYGLAADGGGDGFRALYMTGYGTVASHLGLPDAGLASYADMVGRVEAMARMASSPLIADGDTGYGAS